MVDKVELQSATSHKNRDTSLYLQSLTYLVPMSSSFIKVNFLNLKATLLISLPLFKMIHLDLCPWGSCAFHRIYIQGLAWGKALSLLTLKVHSTIKEVAE